MEPLFHLIAGAPDPVAPFSHAAEINGWIFLTGQMPFVGRSVESGYPDGIEAQTHQVMKNLVAVLAGRSLTLRRVVSVRIYLTYFDEDYDLMNRGVCDVFPGGATPGTHVYRCICARERSADRDRHGCSSVNSA